MTTIKRVAVIGAGTMGRQIAFQTAQGGLPVTLYDIDAAALASARDALRAEVAAQVAAGAVPPASCRDRERHLRHDIRRSARRRYGDRSGAGAG